MSRGPSTFRQRDVVRAIRGATAAGLQVSGVKIDPKTGTIEVVTGASPRQDLAEAEPKPDQIIL